MQNLQVVVSKQIEEQFIGSLIHINKSESEDWTFNKLRFVNNGDEQVFEN